LILREKYCSHPAFWAPPVGEALATVNWEGGKDVSLAGDASCWCGERFGSKSNLGRFSGGGRGGGEGTGTMNSWVKGTMGWLPSSSVTVAAMGCGMAASNKWPWVDQQGKKWGDVRVY
jgi:hypothetical protein